MAGITQKGYVALFQFWSLKKNFLIFFFLGGGGRADVNQQKLAKKIQSLNLIKSHVSIMTTVTIIMISIVIIAITKSDYHKNNNSNNNNNNNNDNYYYY